MPARDGRGLLGVLLVLVVYLASLLTLYVEGLNKTLGIDDYISDEVWYIPASVNVARKVLGWSMVPRVNASHAVYTVFYNPGDCSGAEASVLLHSLLPGSAITSRRYEKIHVLVVVVPVGEHSLALSLPRRSTCFTDVVPGVMPDEENIDNYLNTEHPPLVKYILAAVMRARGFSFPALRWASFAAAALGLAAVAASALWAMRRSPPVLGALAALAPLALAALDRSVQSMSAVAMLDVYAAGLDAAAAAALLYDRPLLAAVFTGLAGSAKYTGLFPLPAILVYALLRRERPGRTLLLASIPILVVLALWAPFIHWMGPARWLNEMLGALRWHTTSRPPGGPPSTGPLGLLLGTPGFTLYYLGGKPYLVAASSPLVTLPALLAAAALLLAAGLEACLGLRPRPGPAAASAALVSAVLGYAAVYAAGNHTLYNFYGVQLSMLSGVVLAASPAARPEARILGVESTRLCLASDTGVRWLAGLSASVGALASAALAHGAPWPGWAAGEAPLLAALASGGKLARLLLAASAASFYLVLGYRLAPLHHLPGRRSPLLVAGSWLALGLLAYTGPAGVFAPVLAVAASAGPGLLDGLAAGLLAPSPLYAGLAGLQGDRLRRGLYLLGMAAGLAAASAAGPFSPRALAASAAGAGLAVLLEGRPRLLLAALAAYSPDTMAVLAAAPPGRGGRGYSPWPFIAAAAAGVVLQSRLLLRAAAVASALAALVDELPEGR
ncbi:hypothetical protein CF15_01780 [Pyrodictium occultum]|uniref:Uncharacterized protein n=1 Tax=Pyrodictium occultum TaxID=2309 RepID=A0A0V8RU44_PYROC|nr:hypothetical protein [Pyrodictium occultum]KSW11588.1 hypothetical protein CF15_01780 [Pyrodictium occultum]